MGHSHQPSEKLTSTLSSTITPSSSRGGGGSPTGSVGPGSSSEGEHRRGKNPRPTSLTAGKKFFPGSHDRAEEAVLHLREQQLQQQQDLQQHHEQHQLQLQQRAVQEQERQVKERKEQERKAKPDPPERRPAARNASSPFKKSNQKGRPIAGIEHHSFFPASNPQTTKHLHQPKPAVPKEVSSPARKPRARVTNTQPIPTSPPHDANAATTCVGKGNGNDNDESSVDFEDDGVSVITQETIDEMVLALEQQEVTLFPDGQVLNRMYSDVTDPIDESFAEWKDTLNLSITSAANTSLDLMIEGRIPLQQQPDVSCHSGAGGKHTSSSAAAGMSPPRLTRQGQSTGTRSFFTKTTYSTQTEDFACAWQRDEQQYWDTLVNKDSTPGGGVTRSNQSATSPPSPSRYSKLRRIREKVKRELFSSASFKQGNNKGATTTSIGNSRTTAGMTVTASVEDVVQTSSEDNEEVYKGVHDILMDAMIQSNEQEMAEI